MMKRVSWFGAAFALMTLASACRADFSTGFESPVITGPYQTYAGAGTAVGASGFSVVAGSVDIVTAPYAIHTGSQALDLVGTGTGVANSISSVALTLTAGQNYDFKFWYSVNNTGVGTYTATATYGIGATNTADTYAGGSVSKQGTDSLAFTLVDSVFSVSATGTYYVNFASTAGAPNQGIIIDDVSLTGINLLSVPEPASMALLGMGIVGAAGMIRRRKTA